VHGESPSAEYAKLRKESLESEFGHALGTYGKSVSILPRFGPFLALYRAAIISFHVFQLSIWQFFVQDIKKRAIKVSDILVFIFQLASAEFKAYDEVWCLAYDFFQ
jgi:aarF domain-containing kinase